MTTLRGVDILSEAYALGLTNLDRLLYLATPGNHTLTGLEVDEPYTQGGDAAPVGEPASAEEPAGAEEPDAREDEAVDLPTLRAALGKAKIELGIDVSEIIHKYGPNLTGVATEDYPKLKADLDAALAGAGA